MLTGIEHSLLIKISILKENPNSDIYKNIEIIDKLCEAVKRLDKRLETITEIINIIIDAPEESVKPMLYDLKNGCEGANNVEEIRAKYGTHEEYLSIADRLQQLVIDITQDSTFDYSNYQNSIQEEIRWAHKVEF